MVAPPKNATLILASITMHLPTSHRIRIIGFTDNQGDSQLENEAVTDLLQKHHQQGDVIIQGAKWGYTSDMLDCMLPKHFEHLDSEGICPNRYIISCSNDTALPTEDGITTPRSLSNYLSNFISIADQIDRKTRAAGVKAEILFIPPMPVDPKLFPSSAMTLGAQNSHTIKYAAGVSKLAEGLDEWYDEHYHELGQQGGIGRVTCVDNWDEMVEAMKDGQTLHTEGIHLNAKGYEIMADCLSDTAFFPDLDSDEYAPFSTIMNMSQYMPASSVMKSLFDTSTPSSEIQEKYGPQPTWLDTMLNKEQRSKVAGSLWGKLRFLMLHSGKGGTSVGPLIMDDWDEWCTEDADEVNETVTDVLRRTIGEEWSDIESDVMTCATDTGQSV